MLFAKLIVLCCFFFEWPKPSSNDSASPICSPIAGLDAQAAFAPQVANARLLLSRDERGVWQCETPVSSTNHNRFGTSSLSSRRQQKVLSAKHATAEITESNQRRRWEIGKIYIYIYIFFLAWYAFAACRRWSCKPKIFCSDPYPVYMRPNQFCATLPGKTWFHDEPWLSKTIDSELLDQRMQHKLYLRQFVHQTIQQFSNFHSRSCQKKKNDIRKA